MVLLFGVAHANGNNALTAIEVHPLPDNEVRLDLQFEHPLSQKPKYFDMHNPARVIIDLPSIPSHMSHSQKTLEVGVLRSYTVVQAGESSRVVLNLQQMVPYSVKKEAKQLSLILKGVDHQLTNNSVEHFKARSSHHAHTLTGIDFRKGKTGGGQVIVDLSDASISVNLQQKGENIVLDFMQTQVPRRLQRRLDVTDFATPIQSVVTKQNGQLATLVIHNRGEFEHTAYQVDKRFIVDVVPSNVVKRSKRSKPPKYVGKRLSLNFQDIQVRSLLQILSEFTGLNIVASDSVKGNLTIRLNNVPWDQALAIILKTQGLDKRQLGNVILVAPSQEIAAREKQELENRQQVEELAPLHSELIQINYAKATEIANLLSAKGNKLLSERGNVSVDERTNNLWIQDTAEKLREIRSLVHKLDIAVKQVVIETRVVVVDKDFEHDLGVKFGITKENHLSGTLEGANELAGGASASSVDVSRRLNVDLPAAPSKGAAGTIGLAIANLGGDFLLDLELSALESEGGGDVISSPRLITANQHEASIESGEEIPYQQSTSSGATAVSFKKAVLALRVTPQITPDGNIILTLKINQDTRGEEVLGTPAIDTRQIETQVLVQNGETIVLGGIYERKKNKTVTRVPFLGAIPVIGYLFRSTSITDNRQELLIFVTPKIVHQMPYKA